MLFNGTRRDDQSSSSEPRVVGSNPSRRIFSLIFMLTAGFNRGELGDTDNQGTSDGQKGDGS